MATFKVIKNVTRAGAIRPACVNNFLSVHSIHHCLPLKRREPMRWSTPPAATIAAQPKRSWSIPRWAQKCRGANCSSQATRRTRRRMKCQCPPCVTRRVCVPSPDVKLSNRYRYERHHLPSLFTLLFLLFSFSNAAGAPAVEVLGKDYGFSNKIKELTKTLNRVEKIALASCELRYSSLH